MSENIEKKSPTFDVNQPVKAKVVRPEGDLSITLRFPTDDEWIERSRRRKSRSRNLGNGKMQNIPQGPDPKDADLVKNLIVGEALDFDVHEAKRILDRLSTAAVDGDIVREGANLRIPLKVFSAPTVHVIRIPSERERGEFLQASGVPTVSQGNIDTYGFNLGAAAELYPKLRKEAIGYVGNVSVVHALAILTAAFEFIDQEIEGEDPNL
jgi:hypothetical protein